MGTPWNACGGVLQQKAGPGHKGGNSLQPVYFDAEACMRSQTKHTSQGKLGRFIASRPNTFILRASDNQFVRLTPAWNQPGPSPTESAPVQQKASENGMPAKREITIKPPPKGALCSPAVGA